MIRKIYVGGLPPPYGGVSVYLYRLSKTEKDSSFIDTNRVKKIWFLKQFFFQGNHYIFNSSNQIVYIYGLLLKVFTKNKYSLYIHNSRLIEEWRNYNYLAKLSFRNAERVFVVNKEVKIFLANRGIDTSRIIFKPAFLPPPLEDEKKILKTYPLALFNFINSHKPLLIANASKIVFYKGVDVYGLDICIELIGKLKKIYIDIGFIFALPDDSVEKDYQKKVKKIVKELNIEDNIFFLVDQKELWPLFKRTNIMLRPTYIDGYGASIEEAIFFGIPAIASDVCNRPKGTILFKNRDIDDLYTKTIDIIENYEKYINKIK